MISEQIPMNYGKSMEASSFRASLNGKKEKEEQMFAAKQILMATGRRPNTSDLPDRFLTWNQEFLNLWSLLDSRRMELGVGLKHPLLLNLAAMPAQPRDLWNKKFDNPWKEILPKKDVLTLREIVQALRWGADIDALTPDIRSAIEEVHRVTTASNS